jgi:serine O-acetyltransferase
MLKNLLKNTFFFLSILRLTPHYFGFICSNNAGIIKSDILRWLKVLEINKSISGGFFYLMTHKREFRNIFYHRVGRCKHLLNPLCRQLNSLFLPTVKIGPGLYVEHGFSTIVAADFIGENVWIIQQVTIGYKNRIDGPKISNNVRIYAGVIVIGKIVIGENSIIGAGAVVTKDVPADCTVVGNPARIVRKDGVRVDIKL